MIITFGYNKQKLKSKIQINYLDKQDYILHISYTTCNEEVL